MPKTRNGKHDPHTVTYKDDQETKDAVFKLLLDFFLEHEVYSGESIMQSDAPQIAGPELLGEVAERMGLEAEWD